MNQSNNHRSDEYAKELLRMYRKQQQGRGGSASRSQPASPPRGAAVNAVPTAQESVQPEQSRQMQNVPPPVRMPPAEGAAREEFSGGNPLAPWIDPIDIPPSWRGRSTPEAVPANAAVAVVTPSEATPSAEEGQANAPEAAESFESLEDFQRRNPSNGFVKAQVFTGQATLPLQDANITISRSIGGSPHVFYTLITDENGIAGPVSLPAPVVSDSFEPGGNRPYATYRFEISKPNYRSVVKENLPVFPGIVSIQPIQMQPLPVSDRDTPPEIDVESEPDL